MKNIFTITTILILIFSIGTFAKVPSAKKCKCDEDAIANRETKDEKWNQHIHQACAEILNKEYQAAFSTLDEALKIGDDSYIKGMYNCLKEMKDAGLFTAETKITIPSRENEKVEPAIVTPAPDTKKETSPLKENVVTKPAETKKPVETTTPTESVNKIEAAPAVNDEENSRSKEGAKVFTAEELAAFQEKGMIKVKLFQSYLNKLGNKNISQSEGMDAIKNALKLFYGNTYVQVSSLNRDTKPKFPTRVYLERVKALNYDKVEIEWADCQYTSNLRKAPDGNYYGYIKFRQRFRGIKDNRVVYEDITDKTIAVILRAYDKSIEGEKVENFDIFLGDIEVVQTIKN